MRIRAGRHPFRRQRDAVLQRGRRHPAAGRRAGTESRPEQARAATLAVRPVSCLERHGLTTLPTSSLLVPLHPCMHLRHKGSSGMQFMLRWESMVISEMQQATDLGQRPGADWWSAEVPVSKVG